MYFFHEYCLSPVQAVNNKLKIDFDKTFYFHVSVLRRNLFHLRAFYPPDLDSFYFSDASIRTVNKNSWFKELYSAGVVFPNYAVVVVWLQQADMVSDVYT